MNTNDLQQLKMAWIAAKEAGDTQAQVILLRDHPDAQAELSNFIAAYHATDVVESATMPSLQPALLPMLQRASQVALERVFSPQPQLTTLQQLRTQRGLTMVAAAKGLQLGVDVWKKVESGAIELVSLSEHQLQRFAHFFQVNTAQFSDMLSNSQAAITMNRRQTSTAARSKQQSPRKESFADAIQHSTMSKAEKRSWLEA
jgi:2-oxo-4-hydroxy-4-carboxy--5-ureidoimidazoline (OHCU) decarboxylase